MIVADTSVWIDLLRNRHTAARNTLAGLINLEEDVALVDVIVTEILQGLRTELDVRRVERELAEFPVLRLETLDDYRRAAKLYRAAREAGKTVRSTIDCLIASVCIRENASLLHSDRDYEAIAEVSSLKLFEVKS